LSDEDFVPRRIIWMTPQQRENMWRMIRDEVKTNPHCENHDLLCSILHELNTVQRRERISGRLLREHVSGLKLPHDALPVKFSDEEALAVLEFPIEDKVIVRMLKPGPIKQGRR
jgi:hypothetical protein